MFKLNLIPNQKGMKCNGNVILIPSNMKNGKKDIYVYSADDKKYVGYIANNTDGFIKRDVYMSYIKDVMDRTITPSQSFLAYGLATDNSIAIKTDDFVLTPNNLNMFKKDINDMDNGTNKNSVISGISRLISKMNPVPISSVAPTYIQNVVSNVHNNIPSHHHHGHNSWAGNGVYVHNIAVENKNTKTIKNGSDVAMMKTTGNFMGMNMNMDTLFGGMIGQVNSDKYKVGMNGEIAIKLNGGDYATSDKNGNLTNVNQFAFDMGGVFIMPKQIDKVKKGDLVIRNNKEYVILEDGKLNAIDIKDQVRVELVAMKNMLFGKEFIRTVTTPFSMFGGDNKMMGLMFMMNGQQGQSTGGLDMNTLMMMSMLNGKDSDMSKMLPMMMMMGGQQGGNNNMAQMMMMSSMMGGKMDLFGGMFGEEEKTESK